MITIYIVGYFIALALSMYWGVSEFKKLNVGDLMFHLIMSVGSWITVVAVVFILVTSSEKVSDILSITIYKSKD